jgi:hypothetical protein
MIAAFIIGLLLMPVPGWADDASDAKGVVDQAEVTLKNFLSDPDMKWFAKNLDNAKGVYQAAQGGVYFRRRRRQRRRFDP